ncbi:MAG: hypothetical protein FWG74_08430, partial [Planctomycetes bacterium]|nr:hypothetical protein [Planctomycetota bacterium]
MAKKPQPQSSSSDRHGRFSDRNLIAMFTLLTHTLENICGRDTLAEHLAGLRRAKTGSEAEPPHDPALERVFRRLGGNRIDSNADSSVLRLAEDMGEAVTRPTDHILAMFRLFSHGDEKLGVKAVCGITPQCRACLLTRHCEYFNNPRKPEIALLTPAARVMAAEDIGLSDAEVLWGGLYGEKAPGRGG